MCDAFAQVQGRFAELRDVFARVRGRFAELRDVFAKVQGRFAELRDVFAQVQGRFAHFRGAYKEIFSSLQTHLNLSLLPFFAADLRFYIITAATPFQFCVTTYIPSPITLIDSRSQTVF